MYENQESLDLTNRKGFVDANSDFALKEYFDPLGQGLESDSFKFERDKFQLILNKWENNRASMLFAPFIVGVVTVAIAFFLAIKFPDFTGFLIFITFFILIAFLNIFNAGLSNALLLKFSKRQNYFFKPLYTDFKQESMRKNLLVEKFGPLIIDDSDLYHEFWLKSENAWIGLYSFNYGNKNKAKKHNVLLACPIESKNNFCVLVNKYSFFSKSFSSKFKVVKDNLKLTEEQIPTVCSGLLQNKLMTMGKNSKLKGLCVNEGVLLIMVEGNIQSIGTPSEKNIQKLQGIVDGYLDLLREVKSVI